MDKMKSVRISKSNIHGEGLFAGEQIKRGENIILIFYEEGENIYLNRYAKKINHSDTPSALAVAVDRNRVILKSKFDINNNNEITVDYGEWNKTLPIKYHTKDFRKSNQEVEEIISGIANVIVRNRKELISKLDEFGIACSCSLFDATEKDLSDIIIDNIENKNLIKWLELKISHNSEYFNIEPITAVIAIVGIVASLVGAGAKSAQAKKQRAFEYKKILTEKAIELRRQQEEQKAKAKQKETTIIMIASLSILSIGALFYLGSVKPRHL